MSTSKGTSQEPEAQETIADLEVSDEEAAEVGGVLPPLPPPGSVDKKATKSSGVTIKGNKITLK